jgi:hypothetical protein
MRNLGILAAYRARGKEGKGEKVTVLFIGMAQGEMGRH